MLMAFYNKTVKETLAELETTTRGLSDIESDERLRHYGLNTIKVKSDPLWRKIIEPFKSIFMAVLAVAATVSLWHKSYFDAGLIIFIMAINALIYYAQRFSTERILRSLQKQSVTEVEVLRKDQRKMIAATLLVPGDVIILDEGDKIPADARVLEARSFRVDESQLTGESLPIEKTSTTLSNDHEIYEQTNMVFQGSFVVGGAATVVVVTTANDTEFGRLSDLSSGDRSINPVQQKIDKLITRIIAVILGIALFAFWLALARGVEWSEAIRFVIALSVSAVPENLPIAISVILVLAMRRMARRKALVRTMGSIESIGAITTIATDKTGTLTRNKLSVQEIWHPRHNQKRALQTLAASALLDQRKVADPLDKAFTAFANSSDQPLKLGEPLRAFAFEHSMAMSGNLRHNGAKYALAVKGAPEKIVDHCDITEGEREKALVELHHLTGLGFRVIALAHATLNKPIESLEEIPSGTPMAFDGFVGVADTLRPEAKGAIARAQAAGISVRMVTGDHFETAYHIGKQLGLVEHRNQVFDSRQIITLSDDELAEKLRDIRVCARVLPEHKHRILEVLKRDNITAMTGDGVNDIPALTNAHVGVAMGAGAQIAKDAGDIILLDNNFRSIVSAIHEGRTVYANIKRMVTYLLSTNLGEVIVSLGALISGLPLPLAPVQILWINLVTDSAMVIPIGLEPGEPRNMLEKPKRANAPLLSKFMISRILLIAVIMSSMTLGLYVYFSQRFSADYARTIAFCSLVTAQWASAIEARSDYESLLGRLRKRNTPFAIGLAIAIGLQIAAFTTPLGQFLHITPVSATHILAVTAMALIIPIILIELHKWIGRAFFGKRPNLGRIAKRIKRPLKKTKKAIS